MSRVLELALLGAAENLENLNLVLDILDSVVLEVVLDLELDILVLELDLVLAASAPVELAGFD